MKLFTGDYKDSNYIIFQVDTKVIDAVKRIKSLSIMKTSLEKLYLEAADSKPEEIKQEQKVVKPAVATKKEEPKMAEKKPVQKVKKTDDDITGALTTFLEMIKARPEQMIDVITTAISAYELVSPQTLRTGDMYAKMIAKTEYFNTLIDFLINWTEGLGETEFGQRIVEIAPSLIQAKSVGDVVEILTKEFDSHKNGLMDLAQDPATKDKAVEMLATLVNSGINLVQTFIKDDMKMTFVNTFLLAQGFPSINSRKIVSSATKLVDKVISIFTPWDVDVRQHEKGLNDFVKAFEDNYVSWSEYYKLAEEEQVAILTKFINENLGEPGTYLWMSQQFISQNPECAESVVCNLNLRMKTQESKLKSATTRYASLIKVG